MESMKDMKAGMDWDRCCHFMIFMGFMVNCLSQRVP